MISEFVIKNLSSGKEVTMGQTVDKDLLFTSGGLDWGSVPASHQTYNYPGQMGVSVSSTKIDSRDITIEGWVYYVLTKDELAYVRKKDQLAYGYEKIKQKKDILNELINPLDTVRITIGTYYIDGKPAASVSYGTDSAENNQYFCKFMFTLFCANPMFKKRVGVKNVISESTPMFHFPWIIPPEGYVMSVRTAFSLLSVENEGDVAVGGRITFTATGTVKNPEVENLQTGQKIKILKTMEDGETITVTTTDGIEKGVVGNTGRGDENYFKYWSFSNEWIKFSPGTTLIGYSTDNAADSLLIISVEINPEKYNLEEM